MIMVLIVSIFMIIMLLMMCGSFMWRSFVVLVFGLLWSSGMFICLVLRSFMRRCLKFVIFLLSGACMLRFEFFVLY